MIASRILLLNTLCFIVLSIIVGFPIHSLASDKVTSTTFVRVIAKANTESEEHRGSGFVWPDANHVVTDFHVVAGAKIIYIECPDTKVKYREKEVVRKRDASIERVLVDADLALLKFEKPLEVNFIPEIAKRFSTGEVLYCWGYPFGIPRPGATRVYVRKSNEKKSNVRLLKAIITYDIGEGLKKIGFPSLNTEVIDIEGHLAQGHSGAPIVNSNDEIVGIGSGGIEKGTTEHTWAIPASRLADLLKSNDKPPPLPELWKIVEGQFSVTPDQANSKLSLGFHINDMDMGCVFSLPESDTEFNEFITSVRKELSPKTEIPINEIELPNGISIIGSSSHSIARGPRGEYKDPIITASGFKISKEAEIFPEPSKLPYVSGYIDGVMLKIAFYRRPIADPGMCFTRGGRGREYDLLLICSEGKREVIYDHVNSQISIHASTLVPTIPPRKPEMGRSPIRATDLSGSQIIVGFEHDINYHIPDPVRYRELFSRAHLLSLHFTVNQRKYVFYTPVLRGNRYNGALELVPYEGPQGTVYSIIIPAS